MAILLAEISDLGVFGLKLISKNLGILKVTKLQSFYRRNIF
jgi:hypothetical protein